ncbi:hypothetical protein [Pseudohaliea sp.]|uniref:hypothetical protein n=1 Tax=Pseudohaliea sp. TaxID=2740289 RepID=UPI0032EE4099
MLRAGRGSAFFEAFEYKGLVFFDLPDANLPAVRELTDDIKKELQRAKANADYMCHRGQWQRPSQDLNDYDPKKGQVGINHRELKGRSALDKRTFDGIETLYGQCKTGDLIIVPGRGSADARVLIGEILEPYNGTTKATVTDAQTEVEHSYPAVRVQWLCDSVLRKDFSLKAHTFFSAPRVWYVVPSTIREEFYDHAYGEFSYANKSTINLKIEHSDGVEDETWDADGLAAAQMQNLVMYLGGAFEALEQGKFEEYSGLSVYDALRSPFVREFPMSWQTSVRSPGAVTYRAANGAKCLFLALMLQIMGSPELAAFEPSELDVHVDKWDVVPEKCPSEPIEEHIRTYMRMISGPTYRENCEIQRQFHDAIGGEPTSDIDVEIEPRDETPNLHVQLGTEE